MITQQKLDIDILMLKKVDIKNFIEIYLSKLLQYTDIDILFIDKNRNSVIDRSIQYIVAQEFCEGIKTPSDFFDSKECFDNKIIHEIPTECREWVSQKLLDLTKEHSKKFPQKIISVHTSNTIRYELIYKATIQKIKISHQENIQYIREMKKKLPKLYRPGIKYSLENLPIFISKMLPNIIDNATKFVHFFENGKCNLDFQQFLMSEHAVKENEIYDERLEKFALDALINDIETFLDNYISKRTDDILSHDMKYTALKYTFSKAEEKIKKNAQNIYANDEERNNHYIAIFNNCKNRINIDHKQSLNSFKTALKKSKMNYIMKTDGKYIYPFLYDFILIRHHLIMSVYEIQNKPIEEKNNVAGEYNMLNSGYRQIELELLNVFKEHFDKSNFKKTEIDPIEKSVTIFLIYYYSNIVNSKYAQLTSVAKQLLYDSTEETIEIGYNEKISPKRRYNLNEKHKNRLKKLDIVWDDFRYLSLSIL